MALGFIVGDTVDVADGSRMLQGEVVRIEMRLIDEVSTPITVEIQRSGRSCIEIMSDSEGTFNHITKVEV